MKQTKYHPLKASNYIREEKTAHKGQVGEVQAEKTEMLQGL